MEEILLNDDSIVIGKKDNVLLVAKDKSNKNGAFSKAFLADKNGNILSNVDSIISFYKRNNWESVNKPYGEVKNKADSFIRSVIYGYAVGDAFGVPYEFLPRTEIAAKITGEMVGYGSHNVPVGAWSDDTSMVLATMDSITKKKGIDYEDMMQRFISWAYLNYYCSLNESFGIGQIVLKAMKKSVAGEQALKCGCGGILDNGNGSLMRILPVSMCCLLSKLDENQIVEIINNTSAITHSNDISKMSCYIYTLLFTKLANGETLTDALSELKNVDYSKYYSPDAIQAHRRILTGEILTLSDEKIMESGYVVDSLETVIYSLLKTNSYRDAIIKCVGMGYDTDTNAALTGALAVEIYGYQSIPKEWIDKLLKKALIDGIIDRFINYLDTIKKTDEEIVSQRKI
ncbi:MAG: ADP-ribosylglycohydrolase family protein [Bacilli bacterium]|nr:ADP-ribosylglycohydrolase family protein [Bacilli bacterium]